MSALRLVLCVLGVYSMFLLWAMAQERLSVPFQHLDGRSTDKFKSALFIAACQSLLSSLSAFAYSFIRAKSGSSLSSILGLDLASTPPPNGSSRPKTNGHSGTKLSIDGPSHSSKASIYTRKALLSSYFQVSMFVTLAAPFPFAALSYITYPTMVLGKSCKLVPVLFMNFIMYRRRFAPHKYAVVAIVTAGISIFMSSANEKPSKASSNGEQGPYDQMIGIFYLLINLILDGAVNSTQDEVFIRYKVSGQQMMFWINVFCTLLSTALGTLPLPHIPVLHPSSGAQSEFASAFSFIKTHPSVVLPLIQYALTGALGQLFIFETLQHFGSLTLGTITLTRKMVTMIISVIVYDHILTLGQWAGVGVVFAGISVEAWVKRKEVHAKRVLLEKEKANIALL